MQHVERCLHTYLRFAHRKRAQQVRELEAAFDSETLASFGFDESGAVFSRKDVASLLDNLQAEVKNVMQAELEHTYHTAGLMMRQLISRGCDEGVRIEADLGGLESEPELRKIKELEERACAASGSAVGPSPVKLASLGTHAHQNTQRANEDAAQQEAEDALRRQVRELQNRITEVTKQRDGLKDANGKQLRQQQVQQQIHIDEKGAMNKSVKEIQARLDSKEQQYKDLLRTHEADVSALREKIQAIQVQSNEASASSEQVRSLHEKLSSLTSSVASLRHANEEQEERIAGLTKELAFKSKELEDVTRDIENANAKISGSKQMAMMKKLMQQKSLQIVDLKQRLSVYETDIQSADVDD